MTLKEGKAARRHPRPSLRSTVTSCALPSTRYLLFGGKGGVGKTTAAAATALYILAKARPNETILLLSTDPAHSLSDCLEVRIGNRLAEVKRRAGARLLAYEMDAGLALERFRLKHKPVLAQIAERGTFLDQTDINDLLNLSLPGLDEVMSLFELTEFDRAGRYDRVVIDTAPSGHTSRMLLLPQVFTRMVYALNQMAEKHRYIVAHFARRRNTGDEVDRFLLDLSERITRVRTVLFDENFATFILVAIPEAMSVKETERYYTFLQGEHVPVKHLIINRIEQEHPDCRYCRARVKSQRKWLRAMERTFKELAIHPLGLSPVQIRGLKRLHGLGQEIWMPAAKKPESTSTVTGVSKNFSRTVAAENATAFPLIAAPMTIFGGKGGVGKTTAAAAFSLALAEAEPLRRVLVFSTDPAHSLSDSFDEPVGQLKSHVAGLKNLDAVEVDPKRWFDSFRERYRTWIDELFSSFSAGSAFDIKFDREAMQSLMELTPPGIDEIAALGTMSDLLQTDQYETIVLDTAPTGHLIRLLELPQIALAWVRTFMKLLLKYQNIVRANQFAEELVSLSRSMKNLLSIMTNPAACEFVGVTIAENMALEETLDMVRSLKRLNIPVRRILINNLVSEQAAQACDFCEARRRSQQKSISEFRPEFVKSLNIFVAVQQPAEVHGKQDLIRHFSTWTLLPVRKLRQRPKLAKNRRARRSAK